MLQGDSIVGHDEVYNGKGEKEMFGDYYINSHNNNNGSKKH